LDLLTSTRRPSGLVPIAIFLVIFGIYFVGSAITNMALYLTPSPAKVLILSPKANLFNGMLAAEGGFYLTTTLFVVLGTASLFSAVGVIRGKPWAKTGTSALLMTEAVYAAISMITGNDFYIMGPLVGICGVIFYYLHRPDVKAYFGDWKATATHSIS